MSAQLVLRIIAAAAPLPALWYLWDVNDSRGLRVWTVGVFLPGLLVIVPRMAGPHLFAIGAHDGRLILIESVSGLFVGLRSVAALNADWLPSDERFHASLIVGLAGLGVFLTTFPFRVRPGSWFESRPNGGYVLLGVTAAGVFLMTRDSGGVLNNFVFSPTSSSGPSDVEYVAVLLVGLLGFMRSPWRQSVAFAVAVFAALSFAANVLAVNSPILPWPNPVTATCCIAMLFPWTPISGRNHDSFE